MPLARANYAEYLRDLHVQVELMGIKVDRNLERMRVVLQEGVSAEADRALAYDDDIDETNVSLMERCYELTALQAPVAADLRLVVSVVRVTSEMERVGDLALRVVKIASSDHALLVQHPDTFDILTVMADRATESFRMALSAWAEEDLVAATRLVEEPQMAGLAGRLATTFLELEGDDAPLCAVRAAIVGQALDRIGDHSRVIGARIRYLVTGDRAHLAAEVR